jgi:hypothetical protein
MLTIAVVAISLDQGRQGETMFVGRQLVNTPSELSAGIVGGVEPTFRRRHGQDVERAERLELSAGIKAQVRA